MTQQVDLDALLAEVRERVRRKRERGIYGADVVALMRTELPGGRRLLSDDMKDPVGALAEALDDDVVYDPTSHKRIVGPFITLGRLILISLLRWWMAAITDRQERINRLLAATFDVEGQLAPRFGERLARLEREWQQRKEHEVAANMHSVYFQARFGGDEPVIREQSEAFIDLFAGRQRVLDLGCGRGIFLELLKDKGIGGYGIDLDPKMVSQARERGFEAFEQDALAHIESLPAKSIDGVYARHIAEHVLPGDLVAMLRALRRALQPGSPVVFVTPNVSNLSVGARTFQPSDQRLSEEFSDARARDNARLLNQTLFGDRDYAVVGFQPDA